jgi:hypothetical protein
MSMAEQSDVAARGQRPSQNPIRPRAYLLNAFAARHGAGPNRPVRGGLLNISGRQAFVSTIVPFVQFLRNFRGVTGKAAGF